jgi:hypothetical protein
MYAVVLLIELQLVSCDVHGSSCPGDQAAVHQYHTPRQSITLKTVSSCRTHPPLLLLVLLDVFSPADLYHLDHFLIFKSKCAELVDCQSYNILQGPPEQLQLQDKLPPGMQAFYVSVVDSQGRDGGVFEFRMVQKEYGLRKDCWMTKSCLKVL